MKHKFISSGFLGLVGLLLSLPVFAQSTQTSNVDIYAAYSTINDTAYYVASPGGWANCPANDPYGASATRTCYNNYDGTVTYVLSLASQRVRVPSASRTQNSVICAVPSSILSSSVVWQSGLNIYSIQTPSSPCDVNDSPINATIAATHMNQNGTPAPRCTNYVPKQSAGTPSSWNGSVVKSGVLCADTDSLP